MYFQVDDASSGAPDGGGGAQFGVATGTPSSSVTALTTAQINSYAATLGGSLATSVCVPLAHILVLAGVTAITSAMICTADPTSGVPYMPQTELGIQAAGTPPVGSVIQSLASTDQVSDTAAWLIMDGRSLAVASYPALFAVLGYSQGGSGANFNIPNAAGLALVQKDPSGVNLPTNRPALLSKFGGETVTLTASQSGVNGNGGTNTGYAQFSSGSTGTTAAAITSSNGVSMTSTSDAQHTHSDNISFGDNGHSHGAAADTNFVESQSGISTRTATGVTGSGILMASNGPFATSPGTATAYASLGRSGGIYNSTGGALNHYHSVWDSGHNHSVSDTGHGHSLAARNADAAHSNVQPALAVNHLVRAL